MNSLDAFDPTYRTGVSNLELEKAIGKDCYCSYIYTKNVLKGKFELGEFAMSKSNSYSYEYAFYVIKGRFKLGEIAIVKYFYYSFKYLVKVLRYDHE